jgi:hypothetical protein
MTDKRYEQLEYLRALGAGPPAAEAEILDEFVDLAAEVRGPLLVHPKPPAIREASWWSCPSCEARNSLREPNCRFCGRPYQDEFQRKC